MITSYKGVESFANAFSSNLNTINLNIFLKKNGVSKDLPLWLVVMRFQMLYHVEFTS